jgi:hypothetical protein
MAERSNAAVLKTVEPLRVPGVRIPLSPQRKCEYDVGALITVLFEIESSQSNFHAVEHPANAEAVKAYTPLTQAYRFP